jgi:dTDP-4-dehydrorhamnose reductase
MNTAGPLQLWGGIECTLNRVGDKFYDQLARNGHYRRGGDLEQIAALGLRTLRYPLLWERAATATPGEFDWGFADERLAELRRLGITPIAGLLHHGSGPRHVEMRSADFAPALAGYAGAVAARFPWLDWYTPVNEPLTTARFCGLYGLWYPHGRSDRDFVRILLEECRGTVLAMQAIRRVNPAARLVQTDDLGQISSTPALRYQAEFENHRRWLAWDLLCGRVGRAHPLYDYLIGNGASTAELAWLQDNPCPPAIIGIDHYVTSDRFLDERLQRYPRCCWGGNGRQHYADVDAVRVLAEPGTSLRQIVVDAAHRYELPIALTEVHIGCTVDEQRRWLREAWQVAQHARAGGIDVRGVTSWALLGSFDWNTLLTSGGDHYEPGVFDTRLHDLRATDLAPLVASLASGALAPATEADVLGWWRRPERLLYGAGIPATQPRAGKVAHRSRAASYSFGSGAAR